MTAAGAPGRAMRRLSRLATSGQPQPPALSSVGAAERCGLCTTAVPVDHRHLMDVRVGTLHCACDACAVLFDRRAAGSGHYRRVTDRCQPLADFSLTDEQWAGLGVPVSLAFFSTSTAAGGVVAHYPGPLGSTQAVVDGGTWQSLARDNAVLGTLESDVEALLVDRRLGTPGFWLVSIDICYSLIGLMRRHWKGLSGGPRVQEAVAEFLAELDRRSAVDRARTRRETS